MGFVPSVRIQKMLDYICEQIELEFPRLVCFLGSHSSNVPGRRRLVKKGISGSRRAEPRKEAS